MTEPQPSDEQIAEWQRLCDRASEGPWRLGYDGNGALRALTVSAPDRPFEVASVWLPLPWRDKTGSERERAGQTDERQAEHDAAFIAWARLGVPVLLAALRDARAELDRRGSTLSEVGRAKNALNDLSIYETANLQRAEAEVARLTGIVQDVETLCDQWQAEGGAVTYQTAQYHVRALLAGGRSRWDRAALTGGTDER